MDDNNGPIGPAPEFHDCISYGDSIGYHIHPNKLLQLLDNRAKVFAERASQPGLPLTETEIIRGQRLEALSIAKEIREALKKWTPN